MVQMILFMVSKLISPVLRAVCVRYPWYRIYCVDHSYRQTTNTLCNLILIANSFLCLHFYFYIYTGRQIQVREFINGFGTGAIDIY